MKPTKKTMKKRKGGFIIQKSKSKFTQKSKPKSRPKSNKNQKKIIVISEQT